MPLQGATEACTNGKLSSSGEPLYCDYTIGIVVFQQDGAEERFTWLVDAVEEVVASLTHGKQNEDEKALYKRQMEFEDENQNSHNLCNSHSV